eukprot:UN28412
MEFFILFFGTVWNSSILWTKIIGSLIIFTGSAILTEFLKDDLKYFSTSDSLYICVFLNFSLAFLLGLYVTNKVSRWWKIREHCIGDLISATGNLTQLVSCYLEEEDDQYKHLVVRYCLLSHALVYKQSTTTSDFLEDLVNMNLLTTDEMSNLKVVPYRAQIAWLWLMQLFKHLLWDEELIPVSLTKLIH